MNGRESPRISVIVPVYRVEPYLARCLDSILGQSYESLEVIAVDDGSPDRSGEILDAYAARDGRLRVIHQENGGLSAARNAGLDLATGEYIGFVDSDDYILPQMYETLLRLIEAYGADIAECAAALDTDTGREDQSGVAVYEGGAAILEATALDRIATPVWCKLYRAGLCQTLRFPEGLLYDEERGEKPEEHQAPKTAKREGPLDKETVAEALRLFEGNRTKAAEYLGISRRYLQYKVKEYNLPARYVHKK